MPQIPQISGPLTGGKTLTSGNSGGSSNTPGGAEPFSINGVNPVQRPTAVGQKGDASVGANNQGVQGDLNGSMGVPVAKDPSMAVETLHDVFSGDLLENAKLNGYTELVGEIDDLTKAIYINPDKLMNEIMTQEKDNTVFSGDPLFDILRQVTAESGADTKELVANLLKSLNYAMSRNEIITAIKSNIRFLADYFGQNTSLSKNLNALFEKWDTGNPAENFEMLKNETSALMRTISGSLQNDSRTEVLVPLVTHNLSRYNTNEYMMKDAFSQLMSQIPSASAREALSKSFTEYVTNLLKANAQGYTPTSASPKDVSAEKAAILIYLSNIAGNGEKTNSPFNTPNNGGAVFDSLNAMNRDGGDEAQSAELFAQNNANAPQINRGEPLFGGRDPSQSGQPIFDSQGKPILLPQNQLSEDGQGQPIFDSKGQPILNQKGEPVLISQNQLAESGKGQPIFDSQGQPILNHKGEPVLIAQQQFAEGEKGQPIFDSQGQPILNQKGEPVLIPQNLLAESGKGQPVFDSQGRPILNQNGEPVLIPQNLLAESGKGQPVFDSQGQPVFNQKGEPVLISQNQLAESGKGQPVFDSKGQPILNQKGEPVLISQNQLAEGGKGQPIFDSQGQPILNQKGEPVLISQNQLAEGGKGQPIFDSQGQPILNQKGEPVLIPQNMLAESGKGQPIFDSQGQPILNQKGEPVLIPQNQLAESGKGQPIFDSQGQPVLNQKGEPVYIAPSLLEDNSGAVFKPIFDGRGRPVDILQPQNGNGQEQPIFDGRGQPLLDQSGQPVLISQNQRAEQGQGQQLFDSQGLPVTDQDGKPVFIRFEQLIPLDNRNISGGRVSGQRENALFGAERKKAADFDSASYHKLVPISENRINYIVNNYKSGVMKGRDAIDQLLTLLIPRNASDAAEVMHTAVKGTDNLTDMVNFLNRVLENTPDIPERQILCDAFEEILGLMAKNQEMPTQKFAGYESETMKALTAFIDRNVNHPAIRGIDNFNASNLLQSMLNAPGVFTPLAHYIIPLQVEDTRAFGELWVDNDNSSKGSRGENEPKHFHLFLTFDVEAVGRFEVDAYSSGNDLNLSVLYPKSYRYRVSSLTDKITRIAAGVGYNVQNFKTGILIKPHTLAETFPRINENRRSFDVKA